MIQVRDVPEELHRTLKSRAAREGMSLSDYLKKELTHVAERPTVSEWLDRTRQFSPVRGVRSSSEIIRELRDSR